jgi:ABC-2 type transport system ATP-binding protein
MAEDIAIRTTDLTKRFGDFTAVDSVSFEVRKGEIFGFLGPNGAGKSTTMRMLCTLARPTSGTATVAGFDIVKQDAKVRENIGLVSEKMIMYNDLTARENLRLFGKLYDIPDGVLEKKVGKLLEFVRMDRWADERIKTFSTGMKQRINVIRALVNDPKILFLDEPTLGLDPKSTSEIRELVRRINIEQGTTIILTTHMMVEADLLCDRIGIIDRGRIVALDTSSALKRLVSGAETAVFEFEVPNLTGDMVESVRALASVGSLVQEDPTHLKVHSSADEGFDDTVDCLRRGGARIRAARNLEPTLEDVFLQITGRNVRDDETAPARRRGLFGHGKRPSGAPSGGPGGHGPPWGDNRRVR